MADDLLYKAAGGLINALGSCALQEIASIWGVYDELQRLLGTLNSIKAVLRVAEKQQTTNDLVKEWISELKDAFYDIEDLIDDFSYEQMRREMITRGWKKAKQVRIFFSKSNQIAFCCNMSQKIREIRKKLDAINADKTQFNFPEYPGSSIREEKVIDRETHSYIPNEEVIGRDGDRETIINCLLQDTYSREDNVSVIAIVGMGGLGKTALAQYVYNDKKISAHFELKLWVCISEVFDLKIIVSNIIESATKKKPQSLQMDMLQRDLRERINGKKYLLFFDDLWNESHQEWDKLRMLLMGGAKGSKIVVTTRSVLVANTAKAAKVHLLDGLSEDNSWLLFKQLAFKGGNEPEKPNLVKIGKEIVAQLKGVPLAIRAIGPLLYDLKESEKGWLSFKDNELNTIMIQKNVEIQPILKLSYSLLSSNLKRCFTYCALFPKDHAIPKDELIEQWICQGFVERVEGVNKPIEDVGHDYFMELLWRSFFQDITNSSYGYTTCKMHDLMHDLACSIVGNECVSANIVNAYHIGERTRHMSFNFISDENWTEDLTQSLFKAKNLRTLFLDYHKFLRVDDPEELISNFLRLRTLKWSSYRLFHLPESIYKLKHLRYLDLTDNPMELLTNSITELYYLETLILRECPSLRELPRDTRNLINLRHLDIRRCSSLICMPKGLGQLTRLQTLNEFILGKVDGGRLSELNGLNNLRGFFIVKGLKFCRADDLNADHLKEKSGLQSLTLRWNSDQNHIKELQIKEFDDHERVLECLQPHPYLEKLSIFNYQGVRLSNWLSFDSLAKLVSIKITDSGKLQHLPRFNQFPSLKHLGFRNITGIEYIDDDDDSPFSPFTFFPSLETLKIIGMPNLKGWWKASLLSLKLGDVSKEFLDYLGIQSASSLFKLPSHLIEDITSILEGLLSSLTILKSLEIKNCSDFQRFFLDVGGLDDKVASIEWEIGQMEHSLDVVGISKWEFWSKGLQNATDIRQFCIRDCPCLISLPEWICNLTSLESLTIFKCSEFTSLPKSMDNLTSLKSLRILSCPKLTSLSKGMDNLTLLESLTIKNLSELTSLPERMGNLTSLMSLCIENCPKLTSLPKEMGNLILLESLSIKNCPQLTSLLEWIGSLTSLKSLRIETCPKLTSLPEKMGNLTSLKSLLIESCPRLRSLPEWMGNLTSLNSLRIEIFPESTSLSKWIDNLTSLESLSIINCPRLTLLPERMTNLTSLELLRIENSPQLTLLLGRMERLTSLKRLTIESCPELTSLPKVIGNLTSLKELKIQDCPRLTLLPERINNLTSLKKLRIQNCPWLTLVPERMNNLTSLTLFICRATSPREWLGDLTSFKSFAIRDCPELTSLPGWRGDFILSNH